MLIYKILRSDEWAALQDAGQTKGAPIDIADGYVHFSTAAQAGETASKWFAGVRDLWLLAYDGDSLGDALKWELSRGGELFPHLYGELRLDEAKWAVPLPWDNAQHRFPVDMT
jgi:uncharacterized protein (DUF952 family)